MIKKISFILYVMFFIFLLYSCTTTTNKKILDIKVINMPDQIEIGKFDEAGIEFEITYEDNKIEKEKVIKDKIPEEYQHYLHEEGRHSFSFLYRGIEVEFNLNMIRIKYQVSFVNVNNKTVKTELINKGEIPNFPTDEEMYVDGYRFLQTYDHDGLNINSDIVIKGQYVKTWIVTFYDGLNNIISTQIVDDKENAKEPTEEEKKVDGYNFIMWDKIFTNVTSDLDIYGIYEETGQECNHNIIPATCTTPSYCTLCKEEFGLPLEHSYTTIVIAPTCIEQGYTIYSCECGDTYKDSYIDALGHNYLNNICTECGNEVETYTKGLEYSFDEVTQSYSVIGIGTVKDSDIIIPSKYCGYPVTKIGNYAFESCSSLTSIIIPNSVTSIGYGAFIYSSLKSITLPFVGNTKDGVTNTHFGYIFGAISHSYNEQQVSKTLNEVIITGGEKVDSFAFDCCSSLTSITISGSVTSIGDYAFSSCRNLSSVTLGDNVASIGYCAFYWCTSLTSILVDENNSKYKSIEGNIYTKDETKIIQYAIGKQEESFKIPNKVINIGEYAFYLSNNLISIEIPDSVTKIGEYAFSGCISLTNLVIPDSVINIEDYAFCGCSSLISVEISNNVTNIGPQTFRNCSSLTSVEIPDRVTSIGAEAFYGCNSLTSVEIPDRVTSIGAEAFYGCNSLTSISISDSVTSIDNLAFAYCNALTSIIIPNNVTSIGSYAFFNCTSLTSVSIGDSVISIGSSIFSGCSSLVNISLPNTLISISDYAFDNCSSLTSIVIPDSVTSIGEKAFSCCTSLTSIKISSSVTSIGDYALDGCVRLRNIIIPNTVTKIGNYALRNCASLTSIVIPDSVTYIGFAAFEFCNNLTSITIPFVGNTREGVSNTYFGYIFGALSYTENYQNIPKSLKKVAITNAKNIGDYAFFDCVNLTSIVIPNTLTSIGYRSFIYCNKLSSIVIPDSVTSIGYYAFEKCTSLTIYCESTSKPSGWSKYWNYTNCPVVWGYTE